MISCAKPEPNRIRPRSCALPDRLAAPIIAADPGARSCSARSPARALGTFAARAAPAPRTPSPCTASRPGRPDFTHPTYANPEAPKGGRFTQGVLGTFDSLNPFIVKGLPAANIRSYVIESLLARGYDEPFTLYGLLARTVETDAARS